jgi:hypothetical protein
MTVNAQSRPEAFDISQFFAPEIITPTKSKKVALIFSSTSATDIDGYDLSKHLGHPVQRFFPKPLLVEELPRGIPWHNFPVVSDPFYKITLGAFGGHTVPDLKVDGKPITQADLLSRADVMVFTDKLDNRRGAVRAYEMAYVLDRFGQGNRDVLHDKGNGSFESASVPRLRDPMRAELRFCYSYLVNFTSIAMKAFRAVGADAPVRQRDFDSLPGVRLCDSRFMRSGWGEIAKQPLALQWLYRLRALGSFDVSYATELSEFEAALEKTSGHYLSLSAHDLQWDEYPTSFGEISLFKHVDGKHTLVVDKERANDVHTVELRDLLRRKGISFDIIEASRRVALQLRGCFDEDSRRFFALDHEAPDVWRGTGKYAPIAIQDDLARVPLIFLGAKLVGYDQLTKTISLTEKGHRLLDMLHPDCEDPDVMLRWIGDDGFFRQDVAKSCDDWIMRFFSKMKTKVNEIEA